MATRGRPRKPTAIKLLDGTFRQDRHGAELTTEPLSELPKAPASLGKSGKKHWKDDGKRLLSLGVLTVSDLSALESYCAAYDEVDHCNAILEQQGEYSMRDNGTMAAHPAIARRDRALDRVRAYQREFGMTPSSRSGVNVTAKKEGGGVMRRDRA